jgi:dihydrodipicolinate synthase/N-acetylneuraminate lyase
MGHPAWQGIFPALTSKFTPNDQLDWAAMEQHLAFQMEAGVHGLIVLGSLGENSTLSEQEKLDTVKFFAIQPRQGKPLLVCIAECATRQAQEFARQAQAAGADGFMLLPPMRYPSDKRETLAYLNAVASATELPIMLYNNPVAYGTDLSAEDFDRLADQENFVAIKESSADTRRIPEIRRLTGSRYSIFCGVDDLAFESFALGADGWVAGLVVAFPRETVRIWELAQAGKWAEARAIYEWFLPLLHLDIGPKFVQQIKLVESLMGVGSARVRAPRLQLVEKDAARIEEILKQALATRPSL